MIISVSQVSVEQEEEEEVNQPELQLCESLTERLKEVTFLTMCIFFFFFRHCHSPNCLNFFV